MKYLGLLRAINVGGNSKVSMTELKSAFEKAGFQNVSTYINSGNIFFESDKTNIDDLTILTEKIVEKTFFPIPCVVISQTDLQKVLDHIPNSWKKGDLRKYIAFIKKPSTPEEALQEAEPKPDTDFIEKGPGVVYMSTKLEGLTKSNFPKLITKKIYKNMTMRNYNTVEKLSKLMQK